MINFVFHVSGLFDGLIVNSSGIFGTSCAVETTFSVNIFHFARSTKTLCFMLFFFSKCFMLIKNKKKMNFVYIL